MQILWAFLIGGLLCVPAQLLMDKTSLTPARILVIYVTTGVILGGLGLYEPLVRLAGAGASVPLTGFGHNLAKGVREAVAEEGFMGVFLGGLRSAAGGTTAAVLFSFLASLVFRPRDKT